MNRLIKHQKEQRNIRIRSYSIIKIVKLALHKITFNILVALSYIPAHLVAYFGFRAQLIDFSRIGHASLTLICTVNDKRFDLDNLQVLVPCNNLIANNHLFLYFPKNYHFISNPLLCFLLRAMNTYMAFRLPADEYITQPRCGVNAYDLLSKKHQTFKLSGQDKAWLKEKLQKDYKLQTDWFVCVHNRDSSLNPFDEITQSHRNCSINNYETAIDFIIQSGGTVFRFCGDNSVSLSPRNYLYEIPLKGNHRFHIALAAKCKFFLGCSSGVAFLATFFGRPVALANMIPVTSLPFTAKDVVIHKSIYSKTKGRTLSFEECFDPLIRHAFLSSMYNPNFVPIDTKNEKILKITQFMLGKHDHVDKVAVDISYEKSDYCFGANCIILK